MKPAKYLKAAICTLTSMCLSMVLMAQDLDVDVDLDKDNSSSIFTNPIFWVGVAVFIIVLALITRSGKK